MPMLDINGVEAFSYATIEQADDYLVFDPLASSDWANLSDDDKARHLVSATRYLDTLDWAKDWDTQAKREAEPKIVQACVILATMILRGEADFINTGTTTSGTKRLKAGSAEIEFFNSANLTGISRLMPPSLWNLIKFFMNGYSDNALAVGFLSFGTDKHSFNKQKFGFYP